MAFYQEIRYCIVPDPTFLIDGICQNFDKYNTAGCLFDNGACKDFNNNYDASACKAPYPLLLGDGKCDGTEYNNAGCNYDGGDCKDFNINYPNCDVDNPALVGNGSCDDDKDGYNIEDCGYDGGDCCKVERQDRIGDGNCDGGLYNTTECGYDGGDCIDIDFNTQYPECYVQWPVWIGNGRCDGGLYNTAECDFDGGDCTFFNTLYPKCNASEPFLINNGICNEEYDTPECTRDGGDCNAVGSLFVGCELVTVEDYIRDTRTYAIIQSASSIVSFLASISIACIIYRSLKQLSVPFHRLLFGLCMADICSSLALSFSTMPAPDSTNVIWNAMGTRGTCQAQGFFIFIGSIGAPLYNCSLCFYYLIVVTYKKGRDADKYIRENIEVYLHAVPICLALIGAITILAMDLFHPNMTYCFIGADPTCNNPDCEKRNQYAETLFLVFSAGPYMVLPCVIVGTMTLMHRAVKTQEKKMQKFGAGTLALRRNLKAKKQDTAGSVAANEGVQNKKKSVIKDSLLSRIKSWASSTLSGNWRSKNSKKGRALGRSNNAVRQSRAVMNRAACYSLAFIVTYLFPIIISIRTISGLESGPVLSIFARILFPLQGFFNFVVFIQPKVVHIKKSAKRGEKVTWFQAFVKAIQSRGQPKRGERIVSSSGEKKYSSCSIICTKMKGGWFSGRKQRRLGTPEKTPLRQPKQDTINTTSTNTKPHKNNDVIASNRTLVQIPHTSTSAVRFEDAHVEKFIEGKGNDSSLLASGLSSTQISSRVDPELDDDLSESESSGHSLGAGSSGEVIIMEGESNC